MISVRRRARKDGSIRESYRVEFRRVGWPVIVRLYALRSQANEVEQCLVKLKDNGRIDAIDAIATAEWTMPEMLRFVNKYGYVRALPTKVIQAPTVRIGPLVESWIETLGRPETRSRVGRTYAPSTIARYRDCIDLLMAGLPEKADTALSEIDQASVNTALGSTHGATLNRRLTALQAFATWLRKARGPTISLTADDYKALRAPEGKANVDLAVEEAELALMRKASPRAWANLWLFLARTGLRVGEALALRRRDIVKKTGVWFVSVPAGKTPHAKRMVPLTHAPTEKLILALVKKCQTPNTRLWRDEGVDAVVYRRARYAWEKAARDAGLTPMPDPVVVTEEPTDGRRRRLARTQGLPPETPPAKRRRVPHIKPWKSIHGLRHLYGMTLVGNGVGLHLVRTFMGHGSMQLTDRYTRGAATEKEIAKLKLAMKTLR